MVPVNSLTSLSSRGASRRIDIFKKICFTICCLITVSSYGEESSGPHFQGQAKIENHDQVQARKLALDIALRNLLVDHLKAHFGDKYSRHESVIDAKILKSPLKYVRKHSVFEAKVEGDQYIISIGGAVNEKLIEEDIALVGGAGEARSRVLIMVAEKYVKDPLFRYWWNEGKALSLDASVSESVFEVHSIFYNTLVKSGYDVVNIADSANQNKIPPECQTLELSSSVLSKMAVVFDVDYILYGKAFEEITPDKQTKTNMQLAFYGQNLGKDLVVLRESYEIALIQDLINGVADNFMKKLATSFLTKSFSSMGILVVVKHKGNFHKFGDIKEALERASERVTIQSVKSGETVFLIKTTKSISILKENLKIELRPPLIQIHESGDGKKIEIELSHDIT